MAESKSHETIPSGSLDELVEFFDTHDMGERWEQMPEADFDVDIKSKKHLVAIEGKLAGELTEIAKSQQTSVESLVDSWLREKISDQKDAA
ncbi:MAG: BrnA antitoxin family protein [Acidobacteriota bacterium]|nr:BrnA antitoxin family protein [Acidobacteriota bacterium]